jgi:ribosome biogenesis GTPase / thiamine phosphate phosphatase
MLTRRNLTLDLTTLGWNPYFSQYFGPLKAQGYSPARVAREDRSIYQLFSTYGDLSAQVSGKFRNTALSSGDYPAVGDWVAIQPILGESKAVIHAVLPRKSRLARKVTGAKTEEQAVAANLDTVFLVSALDQEFNVRRIERYLTVAWDSGTNPVIVLNKADKSNALDEQVAAVEAVAFGVPIHVISAQEGQGLAALSPYLGCGQTVAVIGSSGVGKSTLINALLGVARQQVSAVRADDDEGRHTTVRSELLFLPTGAMVIDNPGMRSLEIWGDEEDLGATFADVETLAERCRFRDCRHDGEPGCAVQQAIDDGLLDPARLRSYRKLQKELAFLAARQSQRARLDEKTRNRALSKFSKTLQKTGGKYG